MILCSNMMLGYDVCEIVCRYICEFMLSWHFSKGFNIFFECQVCGATGSGVAEMAVAPPTVAWQGCGATVSGVAEMAAAPPTVVWQA
jgi:hypothetical protein